MKNTILIVLFAFIGWSTANAQVGIGTTTPQPSSILDVTSTEKGFLPPRLSTAQRDAIASPAEGLVIYNTTVNCLQWFNGTGWFNACDGTIIGPPIVGGACDGEPSVFTSNGLQYSPVDSNGQCWLDRNLGSPKVAGNATDAAAYGDMYQWGRSADGHESRSSSIYNGATNGYPANATASGAWDGLFITSNNGTTTLEDDDWLASPNSTLWQSPNQTNNPCPSGWRVPTRTEWNTQVTSWGSGNNNIGGSYANSPLNLTLGGQRGGSVSQNGDITSIGTTGRYYTSTPEGTDFARIFTIFNTSANTFASAQRADAYSIRCIKN